MHGVDKALVAAALFSWWAGNVYGHGGGLDAKGCHVNRSTGEYHCHRGNYPPPPSLTNQQRSQKVQTNSLYSLSVDSTCYTGPRGGRYRIVNGKNGTDASG